MKTPNLIQLKIMIIISMLNLMRINKKTKSKRAKLTFEHDLKLNKKFYILWMKDQNYHLYFFTFIIIFLK